MKAAPVRVAGPATFALAVTPAVTPGVTLAAAADCNGPRTFRAADILTHSQIKGPHARSLREGPRYHEAAPEALAKAAMKKRGWLVVEGLPWSIDVAEARAQAAKAGATPVDKPATKL
jgi:hypothetical protein